MPLPPAVLPTVGALALDAEILAEEASALGRAGARVEETLAALAEADASARPARLREAAEAVHHYFILREMRGLRRHDDAIALFAVPRAVLARLGAV